MAITLSSSLPQAFMKDTILLTATVQPSENTMTAQPTGSIEILDNDSVIGILPLDSTGHGFLILLKATGVFTGKEHSYAYAKANSSVF